MNNWGVRCFLPSIPMLILQAPTATFGLWVTAINESNWPSRTYLCPYLTLSKSAVTNTSYPSGFHFNWIFSCSSSSDYLTVYDGNGPTLSHNTAGANELYKPQKLGHYCSLSSLPDTIISSGSSLFVEFHSSKNPGGEVLKLMMMTLIVKICPSKMPSF